jgi:glucosyl-3-phosphoglycerate synthase
MGDFHQSGKITTLHNLSQRPLAEFEEELVKFSIKRPMSLVLPSLYSELSGPALSNIIDQLCEVPYLSGIIIGLDQATEEQYRHALKFMSRLPQHHRVLWNDGPRLRRIHTMLHDEGLAPTEQGKGRNVWYSLGYVLAVGRCSAVGLHDCDILTYDRSMLARLMYPVANPNFSYMFCKGYYARAAEGKLHGRVSRLLVTPLVRALQDMLGPVDYLNYLDSFRYPLAGEFSMRTDVAQVMRIPSDWGLEIGVLSEMYRNYATNHLCQADIADTYDHKHQDVSHDDERRGLSKMSTDIAKAIYRKLATQGVVFSKGSFRTLKATYYRIALDFIETYRSDAVINGLELDIHSEEQTVELFANNIMKAGIKFLDKPMDTPFIPNWNRVINAMPDIQSMLMEAVELDNEEFSA